MQNILNSPIVSGLLVTIIASITILSFKFFAKIWLSIKNTKITSNIIKQKNTLSSSMIETNMIMWVENTKLYENNFLFKTSDYNYKLPKEMETLVNNIWENKDPNLFLENKEDRCGMLNFEYDKVMNQISIVFQRSSYKNFYALHRHYTNPGISKKLSREDKIIAKTPDGYKSQKNKSVLPKDLGMCALIITEDDKIIIARRENYLAVDASKYHYSLAEGMKWKNDLVKGIPNPFVTLLRAAYEEIGTEMAIEISQSLSKDINNAFQEGLNGDENTIYSNKLNQSKETVDSKSSSNKHSNKKNEKYKVIGFGICTKSAQPFIFHEFKSDMDSKKIFDIFYNNENNDKFEGAIFAMPNKLSTLKYFIMDDEGNFNRNLASDNLIAILLLHFNNKYTPKKVARVIRSASIIRQLLNS